MLCASLQYRPALLKTKNHKRAVVFARRTELGARIPLPHIACSAGFLSILGVPALTMRCIASARNPKNWLKTSLRGLVPEFEDTP